ncbi:MAG TPA: TetR/AcrR family transcriptional regulator [Kofleriaceae bacterium]
MATKKAYHHGNLRAALVAAALKEIAKTGPDGFSLRGVARRAGVSAPAVYRHFADKDALLAAVAEECWDRIGAALLAAVRVPADQSGKMIDAAPDDALERFRATGIAYVTFAVEHPEHFRAMSVPGLIERMSPDRMERANAWSIEERAALARAQEAGQIAALPLDDIMLAATSLTHGVAAQIVEGRFGKVDVARARELAIAATAVLGAGLTPRSEAWQDPRTGAELRPRKRR